MQLVFLTNKKAREKQYSEILGICGAILPAKNILSFPNELDNSYEIKAQLLVS
jgi:hypothetical protein